MPIPFNDLPLKFGEDGTEYRSHYARYSHTGCPGYDYEDNCTAPWDCAVRGTCRVAYERQTNQLPPER